MVTPHCAAGGPVQAAKRRVLCAAEPKRFNLASTKGRNSRLVEVQSWYGPGPHSLESVLASFSNPYAVLKDESTDQVVDTFEDLRDGATRLLVVKGFIACLREVLTLELSALCYCHRRSAMACHC
jgi:hypothetical protein